MMMRVIAMKYMVNIKWLNTILISGESILLFMLCTTGEISALDWSVKGLEGIS